MTRRGRTTKRPNDNMGEQAERSNMVAVLLRRAGSIGEIPGNLMANCWRVNASVDKEVQVTAKQFPAGNSDNEESDSEQLSEAQRKVNFQVDKTNTFHVDYI